MKCPYRDFEDCIVEKCPACNYEVKERTVVVGRYPGKIGKEKAIELGYAWEEVKLEYEFISCKLVDNAVQPVPAQKQTINTIQKTNIAVRNSLF